MKPNFSADDPARLLVVDDNELARESLSDMLYDDPTLKVVGTAANGREAVELCARIRPDLVLMDVRMPEMDGLEATRAIKRDQPRVSVLMVTIHEEPDYLLEALKAGAAGYVLKESTQDELVSAVKGVLSGDSPLAPSLASSLLLRLVEEMNDPSAPLPQTAEQPPRSLVESLTPRELEVLNLLAQGRTNRNIGEKLVISRGTVKRHVENLIRKLEVSDRTQAAVRAHELRLITPPDD